MPEHPPKAYLAYAHEEGGFVSQVAGRLTRGRAHFDRYSFRPGEDFTDAIRRCLADSDLFVLFASSASIASHWVRFEIAEAELRRSQGKVKGVLVVTIDRSETRDKLPDWLRAGLVIHAEKPNQAYHAITSQLIALETGIRPETLFVGREGDLKQLSTRIAPPAGRQPPKVLVLHGLRGVGRRTLLARAARDYLSLELGPVIVLGDSDQLDWVHLALTQEARDPADQAELAAARDRFAAMPEDAQAVELSDLIAEASVGGRLVALVENGQLMNDEGNFRPEVARLIHAVNNRVDCYMAIVTPRSPQVLRDLPIADQRVGPLSDVAVRQLLAQAFRLSELRVTDAQVAQLVPWIGGFPPAALLAVSATQRLGADALLADEAALRDLTFKHFGPLLERLRLSEEVLDVLRILVPFMRLPIRAISELMKVADAEVLARLRLLIDLNLVVADGDGVWSCSTPQDRSPPASRRTEPGAIPSVSGGFAQALLARRSSRRCPPRGSRSHYRRGGPRR